MSVRLPSFEEMFSLGKFLEGAKVTQAEFFKAIENRATAKKIAQVLHEVITPAAQAENSATQAVNIGPTRTTPRFTSQRPPEEEKVYLGRTNISYHDVNAPIEFFENHPSTAPGKPMAFVARVTNNKTPPGYPRTEAREIEIEIFDKKTHLYVPRYHQLYYDFQQNNLFREGTIFYIIDVFRHEKDGKQMLRLDEDSIIKCLNPAVMPMGLISQFTADALSRMLEKE